MTVVAMMITARGNHVEITRVISKRATGRKEDIYFGYLNGEPIEIPASEAQIYAKEKYRWQSTTPRL